MEVQDHPDSDGQVIEENPTVAQPGKAYPIRLLHLKNGMLIIGYVINVFPDTILLLRPHTVEPAFDMATESIAEYEFVPYLDQMAHYDPQELVAVPFMNSCLISVVRPAEHLVSNFTSVVQLKEWVATSSEIDDQSVIYKRSYPNSKTIH